MKNSLTNNRGSVFVYSTLMIVLLMILVGMGLDTGWLTYVRSQGQAAVDAAALSGASAISTGDPAKVQARVVAFNSSNNYVGISGNLIDSGNITLVQYDTATGSITPVADIASANGVRVALEEANPYGGSPMTSMASPLFLTPLMNLFGSSAPDTANVNVSAVAVARGIAGLPLAVEAASCEPPYPELYYQTPSGGETPNNSGWTSFTIDPASTPTLLDMVSNDDCQSVPFIQAGHCINMNNGQINPVLDEIIAVHSPFPSGELWVPVVPNAKNFIQCQPVTQWAKIVITEVVATGSPKYVKGNILECAPVPAVAGSQCVNTALVRDQPSGM